MGSKKKESLQSLKLFMMFLSVMWDTHSNNKTKVDLWHVTNIFIQQYNTLKAGCGGVNYCWGGVAVGVASVMRGGVTVGDDGISTCKRENNQILIMC